MELDMKVSLQRALSQRLVFWILENRKHQNTSKRQIARSAQQTSKTGMRLTFASEAKKLFNSAT